jgi:hypothetical protein
MRNKRFCSLRSAFASCVRSHHANAFFFLSVRLGKMRCACTLSTDQRNQMFIFLYTWLKKTPFSLCGFVPTTQEELLTKVVAGVSEVTENASFLAIYT